MTTPNNTATPFILKDTPSFIEHALPVQKLSTEVFKERSAGGGQTLATLGSYWKGRKPLVLSKACILGALLPATKNLKRDLEIFEMLMGMDDASFITRLNESPKDITEHIGEISSEYFDVSEAKKVTWKKSVSPETQRDVKLMSLARQRYFDKVTKAQRAENCGEELYSGIWDAVNAHLHTTAHSIPELVTQLGIMRFGHNPIVADTFAGSGQIPFEAARLGCDTVASDLNPIACMLNWANINIVGADESSRLDLERVQESLYQKLKTVIDELEIEVNSQGETAKAFLYCLETRCPQTGWMVPLLPSLIISEPSKVVAQLIPVPEEKRYNIQLIQNASKEQLIAAKQGTLQNISGNCLVHTVDGVQYKTKIASIRGDYTDESGNSKNKLRQWCVTDITFREEDIYHERLYAIQWYTVETINGKEKLGTAFRAVTEDDLKREQKVFSYVTEHLEEWQKNGIIPTARMETGFNTRQPIWERGWTHWHHFFNPRQLLVAAIVNTETDPRLKITLCNVLNNNCRSSVWNMGRDGVQQFFSDQSLGTLFNYGNRGLKNLKGFMNRNYKIFELPEAPHKLVNTTANKIDYNADLFITDPPYGDAVKYEEIYEFFISWIRANPPKEFSNWVWDSRRSLAITGEDHYFKLAMVDAYQRMASHMPDNGLQIVMFTHQSSTIWADMANIFWASGLQVSAAWYVVTEVDKKIKAGSYVKGTIVLVLRKRVQHLATFRDDLAIELRDEVERQVESLTGLNQDTKAAYHDENLFSDADLQMAGYAAALRVLTRYTEIDGMDMSKESLRKRHKDSESRVDNLINYAVAIANQCLIPDGISQQHWNKLTPIERFYLKMLDNESHNIHALDQYQSFAKAFKVQDFSSVMFSEKANASRLKSAVEFGNSELSGSSMLKDTPLRGVLYALMEFATDTESDSILAHLPDNIADYFQNRDMVVAVADYMALKLTKIRAQEANHARILSNLIKNERLS